jgi:hypothetical protein
VRALAGRIDRSCPSFFYSQVGQGKSEMECQLDAMWAGLDAQVPTVNGYSSNFPHGWELLEHNQVENEADERRLEGALTAWADSHGMRRSDICWLKFHAGH